MEEELPDPNKLETHAMNIIYTELVRLPVHLEILGLIMRPF